MNQRELTDNQINLPYWFTFIVSAPESGSRGTTVRAGEADTTRSSLNDAHLRVERTERQKCCGEHGYQVNNELSRVI